jgi:hypothetical protein
MWDVQILWLNVYSYVEDTNVPFYKNHKSVAKNMDILDWIPRSYMEEIVEGGESSIDRARRVNPEEVSMRALVVAPKPLVQLHIGMSSQGPRDKVEAEGEVEEKEKAKGEVEEMATSFTQESETP